MKAGMDAGRGAFSEAERDAFVQQGFVKLEDAFAAETAARAREVLWKETGCDPEDRSTWTRPVVRVGTLSQEPFSEAMNTARMHAAFDELVGEGRWVRRDSMGGFPIRFPHAEDPGDTGWHVDASFANDPPPESYLHWRINLRSKGRALLMLFLFSDVGEDDAPTRIRVGSHLLVPEILAPAGEEGLTAMELGVAVAPKTEGMPEAVATGRAGTVFLCHPFLVHAAQVHRGTMPRFLAQPPLVPRGALQLERSDGRYSLVEEAIRLGLRESTPRTKDS